MRQYHRQKNRNTDLDTDDDREYGFKQTHGGQDDFPEGEWGVSGEFGKNRSYRESDSYDQGNHRLMERNYFKPPEQVPDLHRSRFSAPYTSGQFFRTHYGLGSLGPREWSPYGSPQYTSFVGIGPKGYRRKDERIREDACEILTREPYVDARDIDLQVKDGVITLRGSVPDRPTKRRAEACIEELTGVVDIINELKVIPVNEAGTQGLIKNQSRLPS